MKKQTQLGSAGLIILAILGVGGLIASNTIDQKALEQGKVKINKETIKNGKPVDYSKLNQ